MTHLSPARLVELAEGAQPDQVAAEHLHRCHACRAEVEAMQAMLGLAREVPDPPVSPLLWEHFPARVRQAINREEAERAGGRWWQRWLRRPAVVALAGAMVVLIAIVVGVKTDLGHRDEARGWRLSRSPVSAPEAGETLLPGDDQAWDLVTEASAGLDWDAIAAAGLTVQPGAAERMAVDLSREEQAELVRLLRAAIERGPS